MPFPSEHAYPSALPAWRLVGHEMRIGERVEVTPYEQGEDRHREIRTFSPWLVSVSTVLLQDQLDRFDAWYEGDIQAGTQRFDTLVAGLNGTTSQWWQAQFVGPYRLETITDDIHVLTAELMLLDGPYPFFDPDTGQPVRVTPSLSARFVGDSEFTARPGTAVLRAQFEGDSEIRVLVDTTLRARFEGDSEIRVFTPRLLLLEDGTSFVLLEGGTDRIYLEP